MIACNSPAEHFPGVRVNAKGIGICMLCYSTALSLDSEWLTKEPLINQFEKMAGYRR